MPDHRTRSPIKQLTAETAIRLIQVLGDEETPPVFARLARVDDDWSARVKQAIQDDPLLQTDQRSDLIERYHAMRGARSSGDG